jgi:hypothetical protein
MAGPALRFAAVLLLSLSILSAQEFRGTVQGTILDPNNAAVPNAAVSLVHVATQVERQAATDPEGHYVFQFLAPGTYRVTARTQGFKTEVREGVDLDLGGNVRVDMTLTIGQVNETVTVEESAVSLAIDTTSLGSTVPREIVDDLPLKGHSTLPVALLAPGVLETGSNFRDDVRPVDQAASFRFSANGAPVGAGDVSVDGVSNLIDVGRGQNVNGYVPPQDSIQEFKVQTGTLPAEYGRSGGSITNIVLKSGTNQLHGSAYEYLRNAALDANLFFNNVIGQKLPVYQVNLFGASAGGPIYIPKVIDGRNRAFFFVNYEGTRQGQVYSARSSMPTPKMHTGDFSELTQAIYDPSSTSNVNGVWTRVPLPGKLIPASLMDPVGRKVLDYWPLPNLPGTNNLWTGNFIQTTTFKGSYNMYTAKVDLNLSSRHQAFVRFNCTPSAFVGNPYAFNGIANAATASLRPAVGGAISQTLILSPRIAMDFRLGVSRGSNNSTFESARAGFDVRTLGFSEQFATRIAEGPGFPQFTFSDGITNLGNNTQFSTYWGNTYSNAEAVTINAGRHMFKTGVDIRVTQGNQALTGGNGTFAFAPNQSGGPNATGPSGGFGLASLLLGFASSGSVANATAVSWQSVYYGAYLQDDFRVSRNLVLNLGVRWEYETPRTERYDRSVRGFAYTTPSPLQPPGLKLTGGLLYAGVNGVPRGLFNGDWKDIAPRIGIAYRINKRMAIRTGYSLGFVPSVTAILNTGYSITTPMVTTLDSGITVKDHLGNPFPTGKIAPVGNTQGLATLLGQAISFADPSEVHGQFHNWQLSVQHTLPGRALLETAYVGSRAAHLAAPNINLNQTPSSQFSLGSALTQSLPNPFLGLITSGSLSGATVQRAQLLRPYPQYTTVTRVSPRWGGSSYNSFQARYQKSMARGVTALISYTVSKNLDNLNSPQDVYDRSQERAPSSIDSPQRLSIAVSWRLPVGRGRYFLTHSSRLTDLLLGGWLLSTASAFQSGNPLSFGITGGTFYNNATRANVIGDPTVGADLPIVQRLNRYFNTAAFAVPANFTQGNMAARIGTVRSPGANNVSLVLAKTFQLNEKVKLDFRASQYNFLNHPVFGGQNTTVGAVAFGTLTIQANNARQTEFRARIIF